MKPDANGKPPKPDVSAVRLHLAGVDDLEAVCDLVDSQLRGDAYMPRSQVAQILRRPTCAVWLIEFEEQLVGIAITYEKTMLYNIVVAPWARSRGVAKSVLDQLQVRAVRCKTNMKAGDPTPFYEQLGFTTKERDRARPHIAVMTRELAGERHEPPSTGEESVMVLSLLKSILGIRAFEAERTTHQEEKKQERVHQEKLLDANHDVTGELRNSMIEIPLEQWEAIRVDAQKYRERAEKQRGYQSKRYAKKQKMRGSTGEQSAPAVNVNAD